MSLNLIIFIAVVAICNSIQIHQRNILAMLIGVKEMSFFEGEEVAKSSIEAAKFL